MSRSRLLYTLLIIVVIALGLASRAPSLQPSLSSLIRVYAGDTLWALTAFLGFGVLFPRLATWPVAALALGFSVFIECSQLYHAPWIDAIRQTRLGGLVLGFGFLWSDLVCYMAGVAVGVGFDRLGKRGSPRKNRPCDPSG